MIIEARYTTADHVQLNVGFDDGREVSMPSYPSHTHFDNDMKVFIDGGGVIADFDKYHGQTLDDVKAAKLDELRASMTARLFIHYDQTEQINMANGLYPPEVKAQFEADHGLMMGEYARVKDEILEAADTAETDAIMDSINWPLAEVI